MSIQAKHSLSGIIRPKQSLIGDVNIGGDFTQNVTIVANVSHVTYDGNGNVTFVTSGVDVTNDTSISEHK